MDRDHGSVAAVGPERAGDAARDEGPADEQRHDAAAPLRNLHTQGKETFLILIFSLRLPLPLHIPAQFPKFNCPTKYVHLLFSAVAFESTMELNVNPEMLRTTFMKDPGSLIFLMQDEALQFLFRHSLALQVCSSHAFQGFPIHVQPWRK